MTVVDSAMVTTAVMQIDRWLDSMRSDWPTPGYGGPVVHWWNDCLTYQGTGLDWRYEGIVDGYLTLWRRTGSDQWRDKAIQAGKDLVAGQLPNAHFQNSCFEQNPNEGGTPHEAAIDVALLQLANQIAGTAPSLHDCFIATAKRNLDSYWFDQLWYEPTSTLWDSSDVASFVPNKAATFLEAVLLLADATKNDHLLERYAIPTGRSILSMQVRCPGELLDGAIAQNRLGDHVVAAYFPLYVARCVPPLLKLYELSNDQCFRDGALAAARFLTRVREPDGGFPQVLYGRGRQIRYPRWIAGAGDIVRALQVANGFGAATEIKPTVEWILLGMQSDGSIASAEGFGRIVPIISRHHDFADKVGVAGWCDKAFRVLATLVDPEMMREVDRAPRLQNRVQRSLP